MKFSEETVIRRMLALALTILLSATALAVTGKEVLYVGGSLAGATAGDIGHFDTSSPDELVFVAPTGRLPIEYAKILKIEYRKEIAHHLGVAPTIAVALVKRRERRHFVTITYLDQVGGRQAAIFEVAKSAPRPLLAVLSARSPQACVITSEFSPCPVKLQYKSPTAQGTVTAPAGSRQ